MGAPEITVPVHLILVKELTIKGSFRCVVVQTTSFKVSSSFVSLSEKKNQLRSRVLPTLARSRRSRGRQPQGVDLAQVSFL